MRTIDADEFKHTISSGMCTDSITFSILLELMKGNINLDEATDKIVYEHIKEVNRLIDNAPTVESEKPIGEWNYIQAGMGVCPFCGASQHKQYKNYCPNCGVKMKRSDEE